MNTRIDPRLLKTLTPTTETSWLLWEKKNFNIHRGVIEWCVQDDFATVDELATQIRNGVKAEFRPGWFRGFGFGTVLAFREASTDFVDICNHIDTRNRKNGVWQWAIIRFDDDKVALGIHTWLHGYLRPVYDSAMQQLSDAGYSCHSVDAEVDKLIAALMKIHKTCSAIHRVAAIVT